MAQLLVDCLIKLLYFSVAFFSVHPQCVDFVLFKHIFPRTEDCEPLSLSLFPSLTVFGPFQSNLIETCLEAVHFVYV